MAHMAWPDPLDDAINVGPKTREDVQAELYDVTERTGVGVVMWNGAEYDYPALFNELPKVERVIQQVVEREPALKDEKIVFKLGGGAKGVVLSTTNFRFIAIDYNDPSDAIRTTIETALKPLKLRKNTEKGLNELAQSCNVGSIGLWSNHDYDYESIDRAIPNIRAAIEALPAQTREALKKQDLVVKEEGGQVGLTWNTGYQRKISIDHRAPSVATGQVIEGASRIIAQRSEIEKRLSEISDLHNISRIGLWGNVEYEYAQLHAQMDRIESAIAALSARDKLELAPRSGVQIILQTKGGDAGLVDSVEGNKRIAIDASAGAEEITKVIKDALTELNKGKRWREGLDRLRRKIGKPIARADALERAEIFPDLSKIEAAVDDLLYHGVTFQNADGFGFSIIGSTTPIRPGDQEINYEADPTDTVTRILRYLDGVVGDDRHKIQYMETKQNIQNNADVLDEDLGEMFAKFRRETGVDITNYWMIIDSSSPEEVKALHGLIANMAAVTKNLQFKDFTIDLEGRGYSERNGGVYVIGIPTNTAVRQVKEVIECAALNFQRRREVNEVLDNIAGANGFLSITIHPECFENYDEIDTDLIRAVTDTSQFSPELRARCRSEVALTVSPDDRDSAGGRVHINCSQSYDVIVCDLHDQLPRVDTIVLPDDEPGDAQPRDAQPRENKRGLLGSLVDRGLSLASSASDMIRGRTARGVRRVLFAGAVVGGGIAAYKNIPAVEGGVDAAGHYISDLFGPSRPPDYAPNNPENGHPNVAPMPGPAPRPQPQPPSVAPRVPDVVKDSIDAKVPMTQGATLLTQGRLAEAKAKFLEAQRIAERITDEEVKNELLDRIDGLLSRVEDGK